MNANYKQIIRGQFAKIIDLRFSGEDLDEYTLSTTIKEIIIVRVLFREGETHVGQLLKSGQPNDDAHLIPVIAMLDMIRECCLAGCPPLVGDIVHVGDEEYSIVVRGFTYFRYESLPTITLLLSNGRGI